MINNNSSIRQIPAATGLPDFRQLNVALRSVLGVNALGLVTVLAADRDVGRWLPALGAMMSLLEPALLLSLLLLGMMSRRLAEATGVRAWALVVLTVQVSVVATCFALDGPSHPDFSWLRSLLWALIATAMIGSWLHLLQQVRSPAIAEARLMALSARIRPHFLFNSLNGILGIIRSDPRRAEKALEELAELFRALMQDPRELVPLSEEIALCRQYIELERLRLGERVRVNWDIEQCPPDALMPPLMLQPLLENAVYHGLEPASEPGVIDIRLAHTGSSIVITLSNPLEVGSARAEGRAQGNQMALANIRERLMLFYELAASLDSEVKAGRHQVRIVLPYRKRAR